MPKPTTKPGSNDPKKHTHDGQMFRVLKDGGVDTIDSDGEPVHVDQGEATDKLRLSSIDLLIAGGWIELVTADDDKED